VNDLAVHLALFSFTGLAIVTLGSFFGDVDDRPAVANIPRRLLVFFCGCGLVAAVLVVLEHTLASVR
jgi:hypothetical protein